MALQKADARTGTPVDLTVQDIQDIKSKLNLDNIDNQSFSDIENTVNSISAGEGGVIYDTLAAAQGLANPPSNGTIFQVSEITDAANAGFYSFQSGETDGTRFEKEFLNLDSKLNINTYKESVKYLNSNQYPDPTFLDGFVNISSTSNEVYWSSGNNLDIETSGSILKGNSLKYTLTNNTFLGGVKDINNLSFEAGDVIKSAFFIKSENQNTGSRVGVKLGNNPYKYHYFEDEEWHYIEQDEYTVNSSDITNGFDLPMFFRDLGITNNHFVYLTGITITTKERFNGLSFNLKKQIKHHSNTKLLSEKTQKLDTQGNIISNLSVNSNKITNTAKGTDKSDVSNFEQVVKDGKNSPTKAGINKFNPDSVFNHHQKQLIDGVLTGGSIYLTSDFIYCEGKSFVSANQISDKIAYYTTDNESGYISQGGSVIPFNAKFLRVTFLLSENNPHIYLNYQTSSYKEHLRQPETYKIDNQFINLIDDSNFSNIVSGGYGTSDSWGIVNIVNFADYEVIGKTNISGKRGLKVTLSSTGRTRISSPIIQGVDSGEIYSAGFFISSSTGRLREPFPSFVSIYGDGNNNKINGGFTNLGNGWFYVYIKNEDLPDFTNPRLIIEENGHGEEVTYTITAPALIKSTDILPAIYSGKEHNPYTDLKITTYGDSITALNQWQPYMVQRIGFKEHYLRGIGGTKVRNNSIQKAFINAEGFYLARPSFNNGSPISSALTSDTASGQADVVVNDSSVFTVGKQVLLQTGDGSSFETLTIASIATNTLTMTSNLVNSYTTANNSVLDQYPDGGTLINSAMCMQERINTIPTDSDVVIFYGGPNDGNGGGTLADAADENTTFYAAYKLALDRIRLRVGMQKRIILIAPHFHATADSNDSIGNGYDTLRTAIEELGYAYGYPVINLRKGCGWNADNVTTYLLDTVHPNSIGGKRIAEVIIGQLKTYEPFNKDI